MKTSSVVVFLFLLSLLCGCGQALMIYQNESQLILTSDQIVYGKIVDVKSAWNVQHTHIETTAQILVDEAFIKSDAATISSGTTIPVSVLGGTVGDTYEWVEDMPVFVPNTDVFVYLKTTNNEKYTINGLNKGIYSVSKVKSGSIKNYPSSSSVSDVQVFKERIIKTLQGIPNDTNPRELFKSLSPQIASANPIISSVTPASASAGTDTTITITGSGFGARTSRQSLNDVVFFSEYNSGIFDFTYASGWPDYDEAVGGGYILNGDSIVSWSNTQIEVKVPTGLTQNHYWGGASSGYLRVMSDTGDVTDPYPFAVTFGYSKTWGNAQWKWNKSASIYLNPGSVPGTATAVQNAFATWNTTIPNSLFKFNYSGLSSDTSFGNDNKNLIFYGSTTSLASTYCWATGGGFITNCDIEMNSGVSWTTGTASGNTYNVETTILHELGHFAGLQDLYGDLPELGYSGYPSDLSPEKKVMFGIGDDFFGNMNLKTLSSADVAGIQWIYPSGSVSPLASFTPDVTSGTAPLTVKFTDTSTNSPTSWNWNFGDGTWFNTTVAGDRNATYTYTIPATYTVRLTVANAGGSNTTSPGTTITVNAVPTLTPDKIGIYQNGVWYLDMNGNGVWDGTQTDRLVTAFGQPGWTPVLGDWTGTGTTKVGIYKDGTWYLDMNGNGVWDGTSTDRLVTAFGQPGWTPVLGKWS